MSRRCLICANINPCSEHTEEAQLAELARKDAAIAEIRRPTPVGGEREAVARIMTALRASASAYCADDWHGALPEWLETDDAAHAILSTLSLIEVRGATHYAWITPPSAAGRAAQGRGTDVPASSAGDRPHHAGRRMDEGLAPGDRGMKRTGKLSDADKDKIAELYGDPANKTDWIAAKYGISKRNVLQLAWARGYPKRSAVRA